MEYQNRPTSWSGYSPAAGLAALRAPGWSSACSLLMLIGIELSRMSCWLGVAGSSLSASSSQTRFGIAQQNKSTLAAIKQRLISGDGGGGLFCFGPAAGIVFAFVSSSSSSSSSFVSVSVSLLAHLSICLFGRPSSRLAGQHLSCCLRLRWLLGWRRALLGGQSN